LIAGVDLDGTISKIGLYNPSLKLPMWLFVVLIPVVLFVVPNGKTIDKLKTMKIQGHRIIIISARPAWATVITANWLRFHRIPFDDIFCTGFGRGTRERKLEVAKKEKIEHFFDDNKELAEFFNKNSIMATRL